VTAPRGVKNPQSSTSTKDFTVTLESKIFYLQLVITIISTLVRFNYSKVSISSLKY
jgi:hypothetical protein